MNATTPTPTRGNSGTLFEAALDVLERVEAVLEVSVVLGTRVVLDWVGVEVELVETDEVCELLDEDEVEVVVPVLFVDVPVLFVPPNTVTLPVMKLCMAQW